MYPPSTDPVVINEGAYVTYTCTTDMYLQTLATTYDVLCLAALSFDYTGITKCMELCVDEPPAPAGVSNDIPADRHDPTYGYWEETSIRYNGGMHFFPNHLPLIHSLHDYFIMIRG